MMLFLTAPDKEEIYTCPHLFPVGPFGNLQKLSPQSSRESFLLERSVIMGGMCVIVIRSGVCVCLCGVCEK